LRGEGARRKMRCLCKPLLKVVALRTLNVGERGAVVRPAGARAKGQHPARKEKLGLRHTVPTVCSATPTACSGRGSELLLGMRKRNTNDLQLAKKETPVACASCPSAACRPLTGACFCGVGAHELGRHSAVRKIWGLISLSSICSCPYFPSNCCAVDVCSACEAKMNTRLPPSSGVASSFECTVCAHKSRDIFPTEDALSLERDK
jgi:hypothetical protein